ncbi:MAG: glutamate ligase domain-containing protein, partial [Parvibaculales bacterium]
TIAKALADFSGVKRRFSAVGELGGNIRIFDDYAHHPVEIEAVLESARAVSSGRVIAVMQPHRFTRLRDLFNEFCACMNGADTVLLLPVYEAGEKAIDGINSDALAEGLRSHGHRHVVSLAANDDLPDALVDVLQADDVVICMGAGSISQLANALPQKLEGRL